MRSLLGSFDGETDSRVVIFDLQSSSYVSSTKGHQREMGKSEREVGGRGLNTCKFTSSC